MTLSSHSHLLLHFKKQCSPLEASYAQLYGLFTWFRNSWCCKGRNIFQCLCENQNHSLRSIAHRHQDSTTLHVTQEYHIQCRRTLCIYITKSQLYKYTVSSIWLPTQRSVLELAMLHVQIVYNRVKLH